MNPKKTINNEFTPNKVCPVTGLQVLQKPEWTDVSFSKDYSVTLSVVGDNILLVQPVGYATLDDAKGVVALSRMVLTKAFPGNRPYIQIDDYSNLRSTSIKARKYYIEYMQGRERLLKLIFYGTSFLLKVSIKLAKKLHILSFDVKIVNDYADAVRLVQKVLGGGQSELDVFHTSAVSRLAAVSNEDGPHHETVKNPEWRIRDKNYSLKFEILRGNILHGVTTGRPESEHIVPSFKLKDKITKTFFSSDRPYYYVLGVDKSEGTGQKVRKLYRDAILAFYKKYPFKIFIFYGANKLLKAGINLYRPFVPFKVKVVKDLDSALKLIAGEMSKAKVFIEKSSDPDQLKPYVNEVLQSIGKINLETDSLGGNEDRDPTHPFFPVFEAIDLIKWELDDLFRKQQQTMEKLKEAYEKLKGTQAQLVQSGKLASIGELASGVAHELNQPLMVIRGNAQLIQRNLKKNNSGGDVPADQIEPIVRNTKRMMNIINHLRTFSRQSQTDFKSVDVNLIIEESFLMVGEQLRLRNIEVKKELMHGLPIVQGDVNQLEQVFLNLITNARDAVEMRDDGRGTMDEGGGTSDEGRRMKDDSINDRNEYRRRLEITTKMGETDNHQSTIINQQSKDFIEILVRDNGSGIPVDKVDKIFDPFFTTKEVGRGTGLGLSISYGIIQDHKGKIEVAETGPQGTTFRIRLPIDDE